MRAFFLFFSCCFFLFAVDQEESVVDKQIPKTQAKTYFGDENDPQQEVEAKEEESPKQQDLPQEVTKQPLKCDFHYGSRFTVGGFYRYQNHGSEKNNNTFFGEADLLIPILQSSSTIFFLDVRGLDFKGKSIEGNFGLGIRHIFENYNWMFGLYTFYDVRRTAHRNTFGQVTAGLEVKTERFTFDANGYFPIGDTSKRAKFFDKAELVDGAGNFKNIFFVEGMELALWGFDGEIGYNFWRAFSLFAGGFYFHKDHAKTLAGPMARINLTFDTNSKAAILFDQVILDIGSSYDNVREWRFYAGLKLSWVIGEKEGRRPKGLAKRMTEYVRRDYDVITSGNNDVASQILNKANGDPILVRQVSDKAGLNLAITDLIDVVGIQGAITTAGGITLNNDQTITGGYYVFDDGIRIHLSDGGSIENFDVTVGEDNTIRDLTFESSDIANTGGSAHVGTLMIDNINTDGDITLTVQTIGNNSNIYMNNSTFSTSGKFVLANALVVVGSSTLTLKQFNNNTFNVAADANDYSPVDIRNTSNANNVITTLNVEEMQGNTLNITNAGAFSDVKGILLFNEAQTNTNVQQTFNVTNLANNEVNIDGASTQAIFGYNSVTVNGTSATQVMNFDQVLSNTVNATNATSGFGLYFFNEQANTSTSNQKMNITTLAGNNVTISEGAGNKGIFLDNDISTVSNVAQINVGGVSSGGFFNNIIDLGASPTSDIALANDATNGTIGINVNSFGQTLSQANFNAEVDESGSNQAGITITP